MKIDLDKMLKSQQREKVKGELRAMVAMQGSYQAGENTERWNRLDTAVENFINEVEENGLDE